MNGSERLRTAVVRLMPAVLAALALVLVGGGSTASAHTDFDYSVPADGDVVAEPVSTVTVAFTNPANIFGDGFGALTPQGVLQEPVSVETSDDRVFVLTFDPPLAGGAAGIRWSVQAGDAHPKDGAFSFTVEAPLPTTSPATTIPPTTVVTSTAAPTTSVDGDGDPSSPATTAVEATAPPSTSTDAVSQPTSTDVAAVAGSDGEAAGPNAAPTLDEFLTTDDTPPGETMATVGRLIGFPGVVFGVGALAFAATTLRGRREEIGALVTAIRVLGGVIVVGSAVEYVGVSRLIDESVGSAWSTEAGSAPALRILGGVLLALGVALAIGRTARPLSASVVTQSSDAAVSESTDDRRDVATRWVPDARSWAAFVGVAVIAASFWFDGHTVSRGPRLVHAAVNSVHVIAAAVWAGGVVTMAAVVWMRHRGGRSVRAGELVVRFSTSAGLALGAVAVAGLVMSVFVLDSFGDLTGTEWGRLLLLKTGAVAVAAAIGAYNHFRLLPELEDDPDSPELASRLRSTILAEALLLTAVVIVTALLVAAAT